MLITGLFGVLSSWGVYVVDSGLEANGPRANGIVLKKELLRAADGDSDYLVTYRFTLPSGQQVVSQRGLSKARWSELSVGSALVIVYSSKNPMRSFPEGTGTATIGVPIFFTAVCGSVALLGGAVLVQLLRSPGGSPSEA